MPDLLYLSHHDIEAVGLAMSEIVELVTLALIDKAHGRVEMPPKPSIHPRPGALLQAMPAWVQGAKACGIKWVYAYPSNKSLQLPTVGGLIVLNDPETGLPQAILDASWITAARTGAATAAAARVLANPESQTLGMLGAGQQARTHLAALKHVLPNLRRVKVYAPHRESRERYRKEMEKTHGVAVEAVASPDLAVRDADVVVTAAPWPSAGGPAPIRAEWLAPGVFACPIDHDASFSAASAAAFDRVFADDVATFNYYRDQGSFQAWPDASELAPAIAQLSPRRTGKKERVLLVNLGLGIYDVVVAGSLLERAREQGIGRSLPA